MGKKTEAVGKSLAATNKPDGKAATTKGLQRGGKEVTQARWIVALSMRIKGETWGKIAAYLGVQPQYAQQMIRKMLKDARAEAVEEMRDLENARLDHMQAKLWPQVNKGNLGAIHEAVGITKTRMELNGLKAPQRIEVAGSIQVEMDQAFNALKEVIEAGYIEAEEVVDDSAEVA